MSDKPEATAADDMEQEQTAAASEVEHDNDNTNEQPIHEEDTAPADPLATALAEVTELKDKLLRQHAEMDNLRKRTQREVVEARKFAVEKFAIALLDVVDNLERAVETEAGNEESMRNGIELTLEAWHKVATKFEMERIDAVGQMFDPHQHEALSKMPSDEPDGTVINQHVAGYNLHGRLIRPAKVLVSSGPA